MGYQCFIPPIKLVPERWKTGELSGIVTSAGFGGLYCTTRIPPCRYKMSSFYWLKDLDRGWLESLTTAAK